MLIVIVIVNQDSRTVHIGNDAIDQGRPGSRARSTRRHRANKATQSTLTDHQKNQRDDGHGEKSTHPGENTPTFRLRARTAAIAVGPVMRGTAHESLEKAC
jgi:hypothetical protein